jgi:hypothetical protein
VDTGSFRYRDRPLLKPGFLSARNLKPLRGRDHPRLL